MGRFDVVLVTWNSERWLHASLPTFRRLKGAATITVVDNASDDGTVDVVRAHLAEAKLLRNETNAGFAAAANQGIDEGEAPFVLVVNPDLRLSPDYGETLVDALEAAGDEYGAATGRLFSAAGSSIDPLDTVDSEGIRFTRSGRHFDIAQGELPATGDDPREVFGVSGAAAMYRRSMIRDLSRGSEFFDERFFAYREDADVAWRGRIAGWRALCDPAAMGWHVRRVTPQTRGLLPAAINMHSVKNRFLLRINNQGMYLTMRNLPFQLFRDLVVLLAVLVRERSSLPALAWLWKNRREAWERRRWVQAKRRIGDREIARWFR